MNNIIEHDMSPRVEREARATGACARGHAVHTTDRRKRKGLRPFRIRDRAGCSEC